jgi:hypothetical protein
MDMEEPGCFPTRQRSRLRRVASAVGRHPVIVGLSSFGDDRRVAIHHATAGPVHRSSPRKADGRLSKPHTAPVPPGSVICLALYSARLPCSAFPHVRGQMPCYDGKLHTQRSEVLNLRAHTVTCQGIVDACVVASYALATNPEGGRPFQESVSCEAVSQRPARAPGHQQAAPSGNCEPGRMRELLY